MKLNYCIGDIKEDAMLLMDTVIKVLQNIIANLTKKDAILITLQFV